MLGRDIVADSVEIRRQLGYLPGGISLYDSLSGEDALDYLNDLQGRPPVRREALCERLQMPASVLRRKVRDYSRGMRQKLGVIQALQHDPDLAVLDELTEGLDPLMQQAFYGIMDDLRADGRTIFFSSHVLSEVERVCDRVAIIRAGNLMALQHVDELLARRKRTIHLRWREGVPDLSGVPGIADIEVDGDRLRATLLGGGALRPGGRVADAGRPDHRARPPGRGLPGVLCRGRAGGGGPPVNWRLLAQTIRWNRTRLVALVVAASPGAS